MRKHTTRTYFLLLTFALIASAAAGCGTTGGRSVSTQVVDEQSTDPATQKAALLYKNQCLVCHGAQLEGRMGDKSNLKGVGSKLTQDQIHDKIVKGGNGMIGFKDRLTEDEIQTLSVWLSSKK